MLAMLGVVTFEIYPFNTHQHSFDAATSFAEKSVVGRRPPLEYVGEGNDTRRVSCRLFPKKLGGLSSLSALHGQRQSGVALPFVRGDGVTLGWYVIEQITEQSTYLAGDGVGQVVEVEIAIKRSDPPGAGALYSILADLVA